MPATLTESQLKSRLTNEQLVKARTTGLGDGETLNPIEEEIASALGKVDTFAEGYTVNPGLLTGWARDLAAHNVAARLGTPTEAQVRCFDTANKELADLRDGKFTNIPKIAAASTGKVASGGRKKVL